jgi:FtsP/CotA-like multicopper oxidase with cupredoxin domain
MQRVKILSWPVLMSLLATLLVLPTVSLAQTPQCMPDSAFVADVTVPDDTEFAPGADFDKIWTLKNSGACDWTEKYSLAWSRGAKLTDDLSQQLDKVVKPGETVDVDVPMTAPATPGTYASNWQMRDEAGRPFGMEVYVRIVARGAPPAAASMSVVPMPTFTETITTTFPPLALSAGPMPPPTLSLRMPARPSGRVVHYDLYLTDGYVNIKGGAWPSQDDETSLPGWPTPLYIWGVSDLDPGAGAGGPKVPPKAGATEGTEVGNARYPAPFLEAVEGDDVYVTVHNRGLRQEKQTAQPDQALQIIGVRAAAQYAGVPETAGSYTETLRAFWQEPWYLALAEDTRTRDERWDSLPIEEQRALLDANTPLTKTNALSPSGGIRSPLNKAAWPAGLGSLPEGQSAEDATQFTYYFRAEQPGAYLYRSQVAGAGRLALGAPGALIIRPSDFGPTNTTAYGAHTGSDYDLEYTFILSEIDPTLNAVVENGKTPGVTTLAPSLWLINGRPFPQTLSPFAWSATEPSSASREAHYDTAIKVKPGQKFLVHYLNAGAETHELRQAGWPARLVGANGQPSAEPRDTATWSITPGETLDALTTALPAAAAAPLADGRSWRQVWALGEQDDQRLTTGGVYPGGMLTLIEAITTTDPAGGPTWWDPYLSTPHADPLP